MLSLELQNIKMKTATHFSFLALAVYAITAGCAKKSDPPPVNAQPSVTTAYDFSYSGLAMVGSTITFSSTINTPVSWLWTFGDGDTSSAASPQHIYSVAGVYTATMTINGNVAKAVSKEIKIDKDPVYTHLVVGVRNWRHQTRIVMSTPSDTTYNHPDEQFSVSYINPLAVIVKGNTLHYSSSSNDTVLVFYNSVQEFSGHGRYTEWTLYFDRVRDSIHYVYAPSGSAGGQTYDHFYTKR
jgi:PKD repeat protein